MNLADIPVRLQSNALRIVGAATKDLGAAILGSILLPYVLAAGWRWLVFVTRSAPLALCSLLSSPR